LGGAYERWPFSPPEVKEVSTNVELQL
jgi:hypothetical protein